MQNARYPWVYVILPQHFFSQPSTSASSACHSYSPNPDFFYNAVFHLHHWDIWDSPSMHLLEKLFAFKHSSHSSAALLPCHLWFGAKHQPLTHFSQPNELSSGNDLFIVAGDETLFPPGKGGMPLRNSGKPFQEKTAFGRTGVGWFPAVSLVAVLALQTVNWEAEQKKKNSLREAS